MKNTAVEACNIVNLQTRSCLNFGHLRYMAAFLVQSLIQLSPTFHNSSSPALCFPFSQRQKYAQSVRHCDGVPVVCERVTHVCTYVLVCVRVPLSTAACGFSCRGVAHDTAVNLKRKLINWSISDSLTSLPQSGLCSLTLGEKCHVLQRAEIRQLHDGEQRKRKKNKKRPPISAPSSSTPPIPSSL